MNRHRWAALAALATITLAACGGGGNKPTAAEGQVDDPSASVASASVAKDMKELEESLDISVPEGYQRTPDNIGDTGPTDLEKAVRDDGAADARDVLTQARFVRGYQRMWTGASEDDEIAAYVYQFADTAGALAYTNRLNASVVAPAEGVTVTPFDVPNIHGATGANIAETDFASASVTFVKGPYSVQMVVSGAKATGLESLATALAEEQYSRL
ncbi:MAG TPA: hypothetical protein VFS16_10410 [Acidimicrobiia bacterium]|nr:hypothetical protein [Acidimicrobiia bacterium]